MYLRYSKYKVKEVFLLSLVCICVASNYGSVAKQIKVSMKGLDTLNDDLSPHNVKGRNEADH